MSKKYTLQYQNGKDLCLNVEFHHLVRPGQKLVMSMHFGGKWLQSKVGNDELVFPCPKCGQARPFDNFDIDTNWSVLQSSVTITGMEKFLQHILNKKSQSK